MTRVLVPEVAVSAQCHLAEGPVWDPARGLLRWVDINPGHVHAFDPASGARSWFPPAEGAAVGSVGLTRSGGLVLALVDRFAFGPAHPDDTGAYPLASAGGFRTDAAVYRFNDGKPSPWGDLWAGTMAWKEDGPPASLYRLTPAGDVTELIGGVGLSNGLDWSQDRTRFYFADSHSRGVDVFTTDPGTGTLGERRRFTAIDGTPDGLTLDADGCLWLALWGAGEVHRYTPDGRLDTVVRVPVTQPSSVTFGGADLSTLYITTARENLTPADLSAQPHAGDIFAVTPGPQGRRPNLFAA
jgi:sugar lactone lactonase YvrE